MYLKRLQIQGFKSFAQPTELVFNKELTAVVGPNGSGKSNIADAIRWVLGEQSLKLLRGKKSDDVIFAGSSAKGRLGFARVAIHLDNRERTAGVDYDDIVIERAIDRSGESEYKINNSKVRLTDIQLLLAKARVGQKSYSVVGQGTIDSLLTLSAQERRDFFDEATGVKQYQIKKHQALLKLEHTEDNLGQAELVLHELEPRLRALTRQVKRLERKEELEKELRKLQSEYYSFLTSRLNKQLDELRTKKNTADEALEAMLSGQKKIQTSLDSFEHDRSQGERFSTLQTQLFNLQQEYNALTKKKIVLEGQQDLKLIRGGNSEHVLLKQRGDELRARGAQLRARVSEVSTQRTRRDELIKRYEQSLAAMRAKLKSIESKLSAGEHAPDWRSLEQESEALYRDLESLVGALKHDQPEAQRITAGEQLHAFAQRLKTFFGRFKKNRSEDPKELWKEFHALSEEQESAAKQLHNEKLQLQLNQQELDLINRQIADLDGEERGIRRALGSNSSTSAQTVSEDIEALEATMKEREQTMESTRKEIDVFHQLEDKKKKEILDLQKKFRTIQYDVSIKNNEVTNFKIELAKLETKHEDLKAEISHGAPGIDTTLTVHSLNSERAYEAIEAAQRQLNIIGGIDTETVKEYEEVKEKHDFLSQQTTDLREAQKSLIKLVDDLDKHIHQQFRQGFKNINDLFAKYFKKLFSGGNAKLTLIMKTEGESEADQLEEGEGDDEGSAGAGEHPERKKQRARMKGLDYTIEVQATPPGKKLSGISMLSGGEKALTAIALICAIIANNPPPFAVLDEVDAALDEANSIRFAEIVAELTHKTQFITVTHNRATMHQAKILYGVTMGDDGISRLLSVSFAEADKLSA